MARNKRRHSTGFGYIGFGNNQSVFNRKPRTVFSETKDKLNIESQKKFHKNFNDEELSNTERTKIKNRIREYEKQRMIKTIFVFIIVSLLTFLLVKLIIDNYIF